MNKLALPRRSMPYDRYERLNNPTLRASKAKSFDGSERIAKTEKLMQMSRTERYPLDIYARMVAKNDKQCPTRIQELARPRGNLSSSEL